MGSHRPSNRRRFLTDAALAGMAIGTTGSVDAQTPAPAAPVQGRVAGLWPAVEVRHRHPPGTRHGQPDQRHGADHAAPGPGRHHHAVGPALPDGPRQRHPGHRPEAAQAVDPRPGRSPPHLHDGRAEALPVRLEGLFPRVQRQQPAAEGAKRRFGADGARAHELQRVDRRAAVDAAEGVWPAGRRAVDRGRGRRVEQVHDEHAPGEGDGRHPGGLRAERRTGAAAQRVSAAARRPRLGSHSRP